MVATANDGWARFTAFDFLEFWSRRAQKGTSRWTDKRMIEFEKDYLSARIRRNAYVLDLGSAYGDLSRSLIGKDGLLHAVDFVSDYGSAFEDADNFCFTTGDVATIRIDRLFDVVLLFGVVTYLSQDKELMVYQNICRHLNQSGTAFIKNQCSDSEQEIVVSTFSENLESEYSARYPSVRQQTELLDRFFSNVEMIRYPETLKFHADTSHVLFICSNS